jgi:D-xylose transport system permease protein
MKLPQLGNYRAFIMVFALIAICLFFHIVTRGIFLSPENITNLFRQSSIVGLLAIGMVLVIVSGNIDLSVGSLVGLTGGISAIFAVKYGLSLPAAIIFTLLAGVLVGSAQGFLVAYLRIPAFIVTLGGLLIFRGWISAWMKGETIPVPLNFQFLGGGFLNQFEGWTIAVIAIIAASYSIISAARARTMHGLQAQSQWVTIGKIVLMSAMIVGFMFIFQSAGGANAKPPINTPVRLPESNPLFKTDAYQQAMKEAGAAVVKQDRTIPVPVIIMLVLALLFSFIATRTVFGRRIFAIGGNSEAAFLSGIKIKWNTLLVFSISGLLSGIAGIIYTARLGSAAPDAAKGYELYAVAACVIGGTSLSGGKGTIFGAIIGALIMASLDSGMSILNVDPFFQDIIKGTVLVVAVYLDVAGKKGK